MIDSTQHTLPQYNDSSLLRASDIFSTPRRRGVLPIGKTTFYRWVDKGLVPKGKKISGTPLWPYAVIRQLAEHLPQ
ncbi:MULTISPECIES: AlpA family transcriptional regulator [unclassified Acidovorax]|uniref:helix-turn-helix transcriptional regulator n=1 Tax=unclassified Acidovorax TaxID=2684926 RepID=UPI000C17AAF9|nr:MULTISPECIES: hypothetical protein [unclassified Acidovorax]PIF16569.1 hypothetical protein CLU87_0470 [Acidovorax sp. 59]PKW04406.1 hypothetical protein CLU89_4091 [Acidovorax sp. 30]